MSTDDAGDTTVNDLGGADDMLSPMEATDSDDLRNADGDDVVDPPEDWSGADRFGMSADEQRQGETLDERLAEEEPDVTGEGVDPRDGVVASAEEEEESFPGSDVAPRDPGTHQGQIDGAPEDGEPFYQVVD